MKARTASRWSSVPAAWTRCSASASRAGRKSEVSARSRLRFIRASASLGPAARRAAKAAASEAQRLVGEDPVHKTDAGAGLRVDAVGGEHELAGPRGADEAGQQPVDAVVAGEADARIAGGDEGGGGGKADVAGECDGEAGSGRGAGEGRDGRYRQSDEDAGEGALALLEIEHRFAGRTLRVPAGAAAAAHALYVAARAKSRAGTGEDERADGRVVPQAKDHAAKRRGQFVGEGVPGLRPIEGEGRHPVAELAKHEIRACVDRLARSVHRRSLPRYLMPDRAASRPIHPTRPGSGVRAAGSLPRNVCALRVRAELPDRRCADGIRARWLTKLSRPRERVGGRRSRRGVLQEVLRAWRLGREGPPDRGASRENLRAGRSEAEG